MKNLLQDYAEGCFGAERQRIQKRAAEERVSLEPTLFFQTARHTGSSLSFRIGSTTKYVLKDLLVFDENMRQHKRVDYGKKLSLIHVREMFEPSSIPLLDFILKYVGEYKYQYMKRYGYYGCTRDYFGKELRELALSPVMLEEFFLMHINRRMKIGELEDVIILDKNPPIHIILDIGENGSAVIRSGKFYLAEGSKRLFVYLIRENMAAVYCCDEVFSMEMSPFLKVLKEEHEDLTIHKMIVAKEDLTSFCAYILPLLRKYFMLQENERLKLETYIAPELVFRMYMDYEKDRERITCRIEASYGNKAFTVEKHFGNFREYRNVSMEKEVCFAVQEYFHEFDWEQKLFFTEEDEDALYHLLDTGLKELSLSGEIFVSNQLQNIRIIQKPVITAGVSLSGDLLNLKVLSEDLPRDEIADLLNSYKRRKKYHRLKNGTVVCVESSTVAAVAELADSLLLSRKDWEKEEIELPKCRALYLDSLLKEYKQDIKSQRNTDFKALIRDMKSVEDSDYEVPEVLKEVLREYQKIGYRWLKTLAHYGLGGILADDMGLGKTIQIIAFLLSEKKNALILCPASLVYNWEGEIQRFAPELKILCITGNAKERGLLISHWQEYDIFITSYDLLKRDIDLYRDKQFYYEIIDEAQFVKNQSTQAAKVVRQISSTVRFALTGTPIENRLSELWSIFDYLMPGYLYSYGHFKKEIEIPVVQKKDETALKCLQRSIRPFVLRRLKKDVLKDLPEKLEEVVRVRLSGEQRSLYDASAVRIKQILTGQSKEEFQTGKIQVLSELTKLRQLCCDPALLYENYKKGASKTEVCMELIANAAEGGHKVLLFSQFTTMLERLREELNDRGILSCSLTGDVSKEKRAQLVREFNENAVMVFCISLKAGGVGLNLTAADIVIHFDPWWNAAAQNQATDRAYRIGQEKTVTVYKLIAGDTIEEKVLKLQEAKQDLADRVIAEEGFNMGLLSQEELLELL